MKNPVEDAWLNVHEKVALTALYTSMDAILFLMPLDGFFQYILMPLDVFFFFFFFFFSKEMWSLK